ncbi:hypothetical protein WJX82_010962 [Trebouxia sp. C0006]
MRSITFHSGAIWEFVKALHLNMAVLTVPPQYGYVLITLILSILTIHIFMPITVGKARKKYGVGYPNLYAEPSNKNANAFNCVQRGHQNSLEGYAMFLSLLLPSGLKYPVAASIFGLIWIAGRILYFQGYSSGDPKARLRGNWGHIGELGLLVLVGMTAYSLLTSPSTIAEKIGIHAN